MELLVLNKNLQTVYILDKFESLIWTDRYSEYGDFEIYTYADVDIVSNLKSDYYLWSEHSEHVMIIEDREIKSDVEDGKHFIVTGRSLESLLDRRIVWFQIRLDGRVQTEIKRLLNDNAINPADPKRKIPGLVFEDSDDPYIETLTIRAQFTGDNLYEAIKKVCDSVGIGFKIWLNNKNQLVFKLYSGEDRSYDQNKNPYVVFSPNFENIVNSNYYESKRSLKNIGLVSGEGEGVDRKTAVVGNNMAEGLYRREIYVDARDISTTTEDGEEISAEDYNKLLEQRGTERLSENKITQSFDGQVETTQLYRYDEHFFMGDIVQLENEYGMASKARVVEFIRSEDVGGIEMYPTFDIIEESVSYDPYNGDYVVTPIIGSDKALATKDKYLDQNVIVKSIPFYETSNVQGGTTVYIGE